MKTFESSENTAAPATCRTGEPRDDEGKANLHYELARAALEQGDFAAAADEALACVGLNHHQPRVHYLAGLALLWLGRVDEAEQSLLEAVAQNPLYHAAHLALARLYHKHRQDLFRLGEHQLLAVKAERALRAARCAPGREACFQVC